MPHRAARKTDPETSKVAALQAAPAWGTQQRELLDAIERAGPNGLTAREAERLTKIDGAWKRVSDLKRDGYITPSGKRRDVWSGKNGTVYIVSG